MSQDLQQKARILQDLHRQPPLVLPNAWDAGSARAIESAGARAIATTSAGVAWAAGVADGGGLAGSDALEALCRIVAAVSVPVSADIEGGYGDVGATVTAVLAAGAVGINLEDSAEGALVDPAEQAQRIATARAVADAAGVELCVNARIDTYLFGDPAETASRARTYADAGADVVFVPGLLDLEVIEALVPELTRPLNVMIGADAPSIGRLVDAGVTRISLGPAITAGAYGLASAIAGELLDGGTFDRLELAGELGGNVHPPP